MKRKNIFKSLLAAAMALTMIFGAAPLSGFVGISLPMLSLKAEAATTEDGLFEYELDTYWTGSDYRNGVRITRCNKKGPGKVVVPETIKGYEVKWIRFYAFSNCKNMTEITIPDSVTEIGQSAFSGCTSLSKVKLSNSLMIIEEGAFRDCTSLKEIVIPDSVTEIRGEWYENGVRHSSAFSGCTSLSKVKLSNNLTIIEAGTFSGCRSLTEIVIPDSVTSIGKSAFEGCRSLTEIVIPDSVTSIGGSAFSGCTSLAEITISDSVTSIGSSAFEGCTSLAEIDIPDSVTRVGGFAFSGCTSLSKVKLSNNLTIIEVRTFSGCISLTEIVIPDSVTKITEEWYDYYYAGAFSGCTSLAEITVSPDNKNYSSVDGVLFNKDGSELIIYPKGNGRSAYTVPDGVTSIGRHVFSGCRSLTEIVIPDSVTSIGSSAFEGCRSLTEIVIPDSVTSIGESAFYDCTSLAEIVIPDSVTSIGSSAFEGCTSLSKVKLSNNLTIIEERTFYDCTSLAEIVIPDSVTEIRTESYYNDNGAFSGCTSLSKVKLSNNLAKIGQSAFKGCTSLAEITIPDSVTSIGGSAFSGCTSLADIDIPDSVTSIGSFAFKGCTSLPKVQLSNNLTIIEEGTFYGCTSLKEIVIPDSVTEIRGEWYENGVRHSSAFSGCTSLSKVKLSNNLTIIEAGTFRDCTSLAEIVIPDSVTEIGKSAFSGCTSMKSITIGSGVEGVDYSFISLCRGLANINVSPNNKNYSSIDGVLFNKDGTELLAYTGGNDRSEYTIPDGVTTVCENAFLGCYIKTLTIPVSVIEIGGSAFENCDSLKNVYYLGTRAQWKAVVIGTENEALTRATVHCIDDPPCDHVWGEWEVVEEATYEKEGLERRACSLCDIEETRVIPKLVRASAIELSESEKTVFVGDTFTITATVKPEDAFNRTVTWSSSDPSIVTVDENGTVTAIAKGEAIITAESADGVKAECKVTVEKKVAAIELSESEKTVFVGDTFTITATVKPEDAFNRAVTWSSSDPSIATVDENGTVTAIAKGEAIITAESADGVKAECKVTVEKKDGFFKTLLKIITAPFRAIIYLFKKLLGK